MLYFGDKEYIVENNQLTEAAEQEWIKNIDWEGKANDILAILDGSTGESTDEPDASEQEVEQTVEETLDVSIFPNTQTFVNLTKEHFNDVLELDDNIEIEDASHNINEKAGEILDKCSSVVLDYSKKFNDFYKSLTPENDIYNIINFINDVIIKNNDNLIQLEIESQKDLLSDEQNIANVLKWYNALSALQENLSTVFSEDNIDVKEDSFVQFIDALPKSCIATAENGKMPKVEAAENSEEGSNQEQKDNKPRIVVSDEASAKASEQIAKINTALEDIAKNPGIV